MIFAICYIFFNIYLVIHVIASFGNQAVLNSPVSTCCLSVSTVSCIYDLLEFNPQFVQKYVLHSDNTVAYGDNNNSYAR